MTKLTLSPIGSFSQSAITTINQNMDDIEAAIEKTLSRDGTVPNQMTADFDVNHNDILNVDNLDVEGTLTLGGEIVIPSDISTGTALEILAAIETVDGSGSGLDADLLDGNHATAFLENYPSTVQLAADIVDVSVKEVYVQGYSNFGDGGKHARKRVVSQPAWGGIRSQDRFLPDGTTDNTNGGWWDVDEVLANELMFGGVSTSTNAVQTAAIQSLLDYTYANPGRKAYNARSHTITSTINIPAGLCLEWGWGFPSAVFGQGSWLKGFNGDMITMGDGSMLVRPILQGVGGTWTGRGIVVTSGNDQVIIDPFINDMAGPCLEFPTDSVGGRFRCWGGYFLCHTASDPCIVMPVTESITFGYRLFVNPGSGGGTLLKVNNGNMTQIMGGFSAGIDFTGNTTGRVFINGHRLAASPTITGLQHHISGCSIGQAATLDANAAHVIFTDNIVSGGVTVAGNDNNVSSNVITGAGGMTLSAGASRNVLGGNQIASLVLTVNNSGNNTNLISDTTYAEQMATMFSGAITPKADDGAALGSTTKEWSDLFLATGGVINFANGDVTVTHSANGLAFALASNGYTFDQAVKPATNDGAPLGVLGTAWADLFLAAGSVISWNNDVFCTHATDLLTFTGAANGYFFDNTVKLSANDAGALGTTALSWSDLFLATGGVINWAAGDVTITHSSNLLAFGGAASGYSFDAAVLPSANDAAALGASGTAWADVFLASGAVLNFNAGNYTVTHSAGVLTLNGALAVGSHIRTNNPAAGIGYMTGAGGTVTQVTSKATGATLSKSSGQITTAADALAASTTVSFVLTNTAIAAGDVLVLNHVSGGTVGSYTLNAQCGAGVATITIRNVSLGSLSEAIVIGFALIKGVTS